jgi:hypothetical protein
LPWPAETQLLDQQQIAADESQNQTQEEAEECKDGLHIKESVEQQATHDAKHYAERKIPTDAD